MPLPPYPDEDPNRRVDPATAIYEAAGRRIMSPDYDPTGQYSNPGGYGAGPPVPLPEAVKTIVGGMPIVGYTPPGPGQLPVPPVDPPPGTPPPPGSEPPPPGDDGNPMTKEQWRHRAQALFRLINYVMQKGWVPGLQQSWEPRQLWAAYNHLTDAQRNELLTAWRTGQLPRTGHNAPGAPPPGHNVPAHGAPVGGHATGPLPPQHSAGLTASGAPNPQIPLPGPHIPELDNPWDNPSMFPGHHRRIPPPVRSHA